MISSKVHSRFRRERRQPSDEFLEEIAQQYLAVGRGYAEVIASERGVARRTVVSWVEKARKRGILSATKPGSSGGSLLVKRKMKRGVDRGEKSHS